MSSQKSFQQLTMEKEQALADLNSVERSLSDLFRRYENLKGVLEGFKKVGVLSVRSPWEAVRFLAKSQAAAGGLFCGSQPCWACSFDPSF